MAWSAQDVPDQSGRTAVVTGANTGIGFATARVLAGRGARVVLACRNMDRGRDAVVRILGAHPDAAVELQIVDLSSLASVRAAAERIRGEHGRLDLLVNNAGIMALPRAVSPDGFELQLATNHLGPFALTGLLFPLLRMSPDARVVTVASHMHRAGRIDFEDLQCERRYERWSAYARTKLASVMFALELQRRLVGAHPNVTSLACHPGYVDTQLQDRARDAAFAPFGWGMRLGARLFAQGADAGALPVLYAATSPDVAPGGYYGPGGFAQLWGSPVPVKTTRLARDEALARRLWEVSEALTGVSFP